MQLSLHTLRKHRIVTQEKVCIPRVRLQVFLRISLQTRRVSKKRERTIAVIISSFHPTMPCKRRMASWGISCTLGEVS